MDLFEDQEEPSNEDTSKPNVYEDISKGDMEEDSDMEEEAGLVADVSGLVEESEELIGEEPKENSRTRRNISPQICVL